MHQKYLNFKFNCFLKVCRFSSNSSIISNLVSTLIQLEAVFFVSTLHVQGSETIFLFYQLFFCHIGGKFGHSYFFLTIYQKNQAIKGYFVFFEQLVCSFSP